MQTPKIIAEIGCNHKGDINIAKEMIQTAALYCKADVVKFQKRCNRELLTPEEYNAPHPHPENSYGATYGEHREFLEFNLEQHRQLQAWCKEFGIEYSTSVWDLTSAKEIASLHPKLIKIPSACNLNKIMLGWLCDNYEGEIHLSFGMTTKAEEEEIVSFFEAKGRNKDLVLYNCTSGYPVPFEDICLMHIDQIKKALGIYGVSSLQSSWAVRGDAEVEGTQIDLLIQRTDNVVNLCEMKFVNTEFEVKKDYEQKLRYRLNWISDHVSRRHNVQMTLVTTYGLKYGIHSGVFQRVVTMDSLFKD